MPSVQIRNLSQEAYKRLVERAEADKRSIQQEAAWLLEKSLDFPGLFHKPDWTLVDQIRERMAKTYGEMPDSTPFIRKMRDER
jgi:plasmid stability protein